MFTRVKHRMLILQHFFRNDSNPSIALTWSGNNGVILALTTMSSGLLVHPSKLYRSTNRGKYVKRCIFFFMAKHNCDWFHGELLFMLDRFLGAFVFDPHFFDPH